jgi:hypothetical protein
VYGKARRFGIGAWIAGRSFLQSTVGVGVGNDVDPVSATNEGFSQEADEHRVSSEVMRGIEGCNQGKVYFLTHSTFASSIELGGVD